MVDDILEESTTPGAGRGITNAAVGAVGATAILGGMMNKVPRLSELQQVAMLEGGAEGAAGEVCQQDSFPLDKVSFGKRKGGEVVPYCSISLEGEVASGC